MGSSQESQSESQQMESESGAYYGGQEEDEFEDYEVQPFDSQNSSEYNHD